MENKNMNNSLTLKNFLNMRTDSDFDVSVLYNWNGLKEEYDYLRKINSKNINTLPAELLDSTVYDYHIEENSEDEALLVVGTSYIEENSKDIAGTVSDKDFIKGYNKTERQNIILQIVDRAKALNIIKFDNDIVGAIMDIESADIAFHLRLKEFLNAKDFDFVHDFTGIQNNIVRNDFPSINFGFFVPRFAGRANDNE